MKNHSLRNWPTLARAQAKSVSEEQTEKGLTLSDPNIEPPDDIERNVPNWVFLTQQNFPTRHQSRPDGVLVTPIEGRGRQLDPKQIPTRDTDIHLENSVSAQT